MGDRILKKVQLVYRKILNILHLNNGVGSKHRRRMHTKAGVVLGNSRCLERKAGAEHILNERRSWHEVLELEVEYALEALHGERAQLRQCTQHTAEVRRAPHARAAAARHVRAQAPDDLHLQLLHPVRLLQSVTLC